MPSIQPTSDMLGSVYGFAVSTIPFLDTVAAQERLALTLAMVAMGDAARSPGAPGVNGVTRSSVYW